MCVCDSNNGGVNVVFDFFERIVLTCVYFRKILGKWKKTGFTGAKRTKCKLPRASIRVILYVSNQKVWILWLMCILTTPTSLEYTCSCEDFTWDITTIREVFFYYTIGLTRMTVHTWIFTIRKLNKNNGKLKEFVPQFICFPNDAPCTFQIFDDSQTLLLCVSREIESGFVMRSWSTAFRFENSI